MKPIFIGIAGGTGAGKSTLCTALTEKYPEKVGLIQLDDYFKPSLEVPKYEKHINWDHPDALYFNKLLKDLVELSEGKSVIINTKNKKLNPEYKKTDKRISVEFKPKPIMLIEGYLILYNKEIRKLMTTSIYLDVDHKTRWARRVHFKNSEYEEKVLLPMHKEFVEPTKQHAIKILDVSNLSKGQVFDKVESIITEFL